MKRILSVLVLGAACLAASAQEENRGWSFDASAGLNSNYYFAGITSGGIQTVAELSATYQFTDNFNLGGYAFFTGDWNSGIATAPLTMVTDSYTMACFGLTSEMWNFDLTVLGEWYPGNGTVGTAELGFTVSEDIPLRLSWYTAFCGAYDQDENGKQYFSTLLKATYELYFFEERLCVTPTIEYTPWNSPFNDEFEAAHWNFAGASATWNFLDGALPVSVLAGWNPTFDSPVIQFGVMYSFSL